MLSAEIGKLIKRARRKRGLSQAQLAARIGLADHSSISKLEKGRWNPSLEIIDKIAAALQMEPVMVFEDKLKKD